MACKSSSNQNVGINDTISVWGMGFENYRFVDASIAGLNKDQVPD